MPLLWVALGALLGGGAAGVAQWRRARRLTPEVGEQRTTAPLGPGGSAAATGAGNTDGERELVDEALRDVCGALGARECIYWRWVESRGSLSPGGWSSESARPTHFRMAEWGPLVRWSAEERQDQIVEVEGIPVLATAVVEGSRGLLGVVSATFDGDDIPTRAALDAAMPGFARVVARAVELSELRRDFARFVGQTNALIAAVRGLQEHTSAASLAEAIAATAIEVTSADGGALVRWYPEERRGVIEFASAAFQRTRGDVVDVNSLVGEACREGLPLVLADARSATSGRSPFGGAGGGAAAGSLLVIPVVREQEVLGAIVAQSSVVEGLGPQDARNLGLVAALTRGSLEIAWEIQSVTAKALTDPLTGLANRRHFDERLKRVLAETDRFGGSCAMVIADLDHFKRVNDSLGHEAGDEVLRQVGRTVAESVRTVDLCARYGGEEIAILLPQTGLVGAAELAERLRVALERRPVRWREQEIAVTASFGVAAYPDPVPQGDWLFLAADRALYQAKGSGRNNVKTIAASDVTPALYRSSR